MFLGIDLGTSSVKALLVDEAGAVQGEGTTDYPLHAPRPGWVEQNPEDWWAATVTAVRAALAEKTGVVKAIGLSGQMHSLVLLGESGKPTRPAVIWADTRAAAEVDAFNAKVDRDTQIHVLGNPAATGFTALSLMWVKALEPQVYTASRCALLPKDYLRYRLTNVLATDPTDASATLLFDVLKRAWAQGVVEALELNPALLPPVLPSDEVAGELTKEAAEALGLPSGLPVVTGAGDQASAATGCGVFHPGSMLITLGSGGQVFAALETPTPDPALQVHLFCHVRNWHLLGAVQNVGLALGWTRELFGWDWEAFFRQAASVPPGADGLLFLPYLTGERTPHMDPHAKGTFHGLTLAHGPAHVARAALEGTTFALKDAVDALERVGGTAERLILTGGGARSPLRQQLLADVLNRSLYAADVDNASAKGAAVLAGAGVRGWGPTLIAEPESNAALYGDLMTRYRALYKALKEG